MKQLTIITLLLLAFNGIFGQINVSQDTSEYPYWIELMKNPDANFFETQNAFNKYWQNREITRGSGYKPFKRWENFMLTRVDENGNLPDYSKNYKAFQKLKRGSKSKSYTGNWSLLGPVDLPNPETNQPNGLGRLNVVAFHPTNPDIIYSGAPSGGFWKSTDGGNTWITTTDRLPTLGVSAIAIDYTNPNIIYIGSGDRDASDAPGLGVFKSTDGGESWTRMSSSMEFATVNNILIHPENPQLLYAGTSQGIYKSVNGAENWELITSGNVEFMEFKPGNPNTIYAIRGASFIVTTDGGNIWRTVTRGLQSWSRAILAVTPANPEYVYILATNQRSFKAMFRSVDSGNSFEIQSTTPNLMGYQWNGTDDGGQAWYNLALSADPINPEIIYAGGINIFKSTDGGKTWKINAHWLGTNAPPVHADQHFLAFNPVNNRLYSANDGGLYFTDNGGISWANISGGIAISQIYKIGQSNTIKDLVICGNQDNGTSLFSNGSWSTVVGGDGMECIVDPTDDKYKYTALYYGNIRRSVNNGPYYSIAGYDVNGIDEQGAWVTPYALNEADPNTMYIGMNNIWISKNVRTSSYNSVSWKRIAGSSYSNQSYIRVIENSPANPDILYFSRDNNTVYISRNVNAGSPEWEQITALPNTLVTDIEAHPTDENVVYVTCSNESVYKSEDQGQNWRNITINLPSVSINTIVYDKNTNEGLYLGTDIGVFFKDATMNEWVYFSEGFPASAEVTELEIFYDTQQPENNRLRASTYGRGLWESDLFTDNITEDYKVRVTGIYSPNGNYNPGDSIAAQIRLRNTGLYNIDSIELISQVDNNESVQYNWYGIIGSGQNQTIDLPKIVTHAGSHVYSVLVKSINNVESDERISSQFSVKKNNKIQLTLKTDSLASETSWKLNTADGETLYNSEAYFNDSMYEITADFYLNSGCYELVIIDENGICCNQGDGYYSLSNVSNQMVLGQGSAFENNDTLIFCVDEFPAPDFNASITYAQVSSTITFENKTSDDGYSYHWNFGDGASPQTAETFNAPEVEYATPGIKTISLMANNNGNIVTETKDKYVYIYSMPGIIHQPKADTICMNEKLELEVMAEGLNLNYRWYKDEETLFGQTNRKLTFENADTSLSGKYYCKVSNLLFTTYTDTVNILVKPKPEIALSPGNSIICSGDEITLTAEGSGDFSWSHSTETTAEVVVAPSVNTSYTVYLKQNGCIASQEASVAVTEAPEINLQPIGEQLCETQGATFIVQASGFGLIYSWQKNGDELAGESNIFHIDSLLLDDAGDYKCVISNVCGNVVSDAATLQVNPMPQAGFTIEKEGNSVYFTSTGDYIENYYWDFGDDNYGFSANPEHTYEPGSYRPLQTVTNDCGTDTMSMQVSIFPDNIYQTDLSKKLSVFPNPNSGYFNFEFSAETYRGTVKVLLTNIEGKVLINKNIDMKTSKISLPIDAEHLAPGLYQLQLFTGKQVIMHKVIVN